MAKRPVPLYDFKAFGAAIKAARKEYGESRKTVSDALYISPRYLANTQVNGRDFNTLDGEPFLKLTARDDRLYLEH